MSQNKRIDKLVSLKERAVDAAQAVLVTARSNVATAEHMLAATEESVRLAAEHSAKATTCADLADADARVRTLRMAVQRAAWTLATRKREEEQRYQAVVKARMELRRFELWGERTVATAHAVQARIVRGAEDDLAARKRQEA